MRNDPGIKIRRIKIARQYKEDVRKAGADIQVYGGVEDTVFAVQPMTPAGQAWMDEHVPPGADRTYLGNSLMVEHRYIRDLVKGMRGDGLVVA